MRFWIQYHNYDRLGYLPGGHETEVTDLSTLDTSTFEEVGVTTSKRTISDTVGDIVFLIVGYGGKSKKYILWHWFIVEDVVEREDGLFDAFGPGRLLSPLPLLAGLEFEEFKRQIANFSLGFQNISNLPYLSRIITLARERGQFELSEMYVRALSSIPEEVREATNLYEGAVRVITVNAYERNPEARRRCIEHYGFRCVICNFDFNSVYGPIADGIIHVHHLRPLSEIGKEYEVDPIVDLKPVCPNCHAVIHARNPAYSIEEVKAVLKRG